MNLDQIKQVIRTEKSIRLNEDNQYVFDVDSQLTKPEIRAIIEKYFSVRVLSVNTHRLPVSRRKGRNRMTKRALVTIASTN